MFGQMTESQRIAMADLAEFGRACIASYDVLRLLNLESTDATKMLLERSLASREASAAERVADNEALADDGETAVPEESPEPEASAGGRLIERKMTAAGEMINLCYGDADNWVLRRLVGIVRDLGRAGCSVDRIDGMWMCKSTYSASEVLDEIAVDSVAAAVPDGAPDGTTARTIGESLARKIRDAFPPRYEVREAEINYTDDGGMSVSCLVDGDVWHGVWDRAEEKFCEEAGFVLRRSAENECEILNSMLHSDLAWSPAAGDETAVA